MSIVLRGQRDVGLTVWRAFRTAVFQGVLYTARRTAFHSTLEQRCALFRIHTDAEYSDLPVVSPFLFVCLEADQRETPCVFIQ